MSKKQKKKELLAQQKAAAEAEAARRARPRVVYATVCPNGIVPIAPPARNIQLTPIVQPVAMVPYSTQQQPMFGVMRDDDYDY